MEQESAFNELKHRLTIAPVLAYPDFNPDWGLLVVDTDAGQPLGIGAVLSRLQPNDTEHVITYGSRSLKEQEKNYCGTRLDMLALVNYMDHFCYYLVGQKYRLRTDNHSLVWLMSFKEPQGQVARWLGRLQYDSEIQRRPGRLHDNADAFSRRPRRQHGNCPSSSPTGLSQVTIVSRDFPVGETPKWSEKLLVARSGSTGPKRWSRYQRGS